MNILVIGNGAREHSLCWALNKSNIKKRIFCIPGNAGIQEVVDSFNIEINKKKIGIGSMSPTSNKEELERDYQRGIEQRRKEQTECRKSVYMQNPVNECYFQINKILK